MNSATSSFPVPVSPVISTVQLELAAFCRYFRISIMESLAATIWLEPLPANWLVENSISPCSRGRCFWIRAKNDGDRKSTRLNSSHVAISYAVFCLKKKKKKNKQYKKLR